MVILSSKEYDSTLYMYYIMEFSLGFFLQYNTKEKYPKQNAEMQNKYFEITLFILRCYRSKTDSRD